MFFVLYQKNVNYSLFLKFELNFHFNNKKIVEITWLICMFADVVVILFLIRMKIANQLNQMVVSMLQFEIIFFYLRNTREKHIALNS